MRESKIHSECFQWHHNTFPDQRGLLCYNLGNSANKIQGNLNKAMGIIKGRSDFSFYWKGKAYFIELKSPGERQTPEQVKWQLKMEFNGFEYYLCTSLLDFKSLMYDITLH